MHELGLCEGIVDAVLRRADGRRVRRARVRVGGHPVDPAVIEQGVRVAASGTVAEGLSVDLVMEPMVARCRGCGHETETSNAMALTACGRCGGVDVELAGDEAAVLESIVLTAPDADR